MLITPSDPGAIVQVPAAALGMQYPANLPRARVLIADPPWQPGDALGKRGAEAQYPCLSLDELKAFPLPPLEDECVLFLWRLSSMQREAFEVLDAWGFKHHSELVWVKLTSTGRSLHFGMGRIVRGAHETCLIAVRRTGKRARKPTVKSLSVRSVFAAPVGAHSAKPDAFYRKVEQLFDGPYTELFARRRWPSWACFGNQLQPANDNAPKQEPLPECIGRPERPLLLQGG